MFEIPSVDCFVIRHDFQSVFMNVNKCIMLYPCIVVRGSFSINIADLIPIYDQVNLCYINSLPHLMSSTCPLEIVRAFVFNLNRIALRTAKTLWSFGRSECTRVKALQKQMSGTCLLVIVRAFVFNFNPIALRTAKTLWSFGRSECIRVKALQKQTIK